MNYSHIAVLLIALLIGVMFAGWLRSLPVISMLPKY
jgi:hypothetical protein